ncbi:hypothetical protein CEQ90_11450 [Lewinellaceae bacterium SD302]|nr:hypothetical protein CEQ90_11450 [Lewinellaceae bacterium SD302]
MVYEWFTSTDGFNFTFAGSGSSLTTTVSFPGSNEDFFVQLFARCDDGDGDPTNDETDTETFMFFEFDELCPDPTQQCFGGGGSDSDRNGVKVAADIKVFPNPASNFLQFAFSEEWHATEKLIKYRIKNLAGATIITGNISPFENNSRTVDVTDLISGMYFVNFESGQESLTVKFIKQ